MPLSLSEKSSCVMQSEIRAMTIECARQDGINLAQGVCDTEVPLVARHAASTAMHAGMNIYTRFDGLPELRQAIAKKLSQRGFQANPEGEITICPGATGAFYCACLALLNPGDEVILFEPYYGYHVSTLRALDFVPKFVRLTPGEPGLSGKSDWTFDPAQLELVRTSKTRAILINTPANPSGKVFTRAELETLSAFSVKHDLFVFTDEIYEYFVYDQREHIFPANLPGMKERTIAIGGLSKTFSVTGWRIGYAVSAPRWAQAIGYFNDLVYVCAPAPLQMGVAKGLEALPEKYYVDLLAEYKGKRDQMCAALISAGLAPHVPQGAYYVLADISRLPGKTGKDRALHLLKERGVACVPGEAFYQNPADGYGLGRFCFAKNTKDLDEACSRLTRS